MKWRSKNTLPKLKEGEVYGRILTAYFSDKPIYKDDNLRRLGEIIYTHDSDTSAFTHWMPFDEYWDVLKNLERE